MLSNKHLADSAQDTADQAASRTNSAIRSGKRVANDALDSLSDTVSDLRDQATPVISRLSGQAEQMARRGLDAARDTSQQLRESAARAGDTTVAYVKDSPVKSILIAAATGAALMALVSLLSSRDRNY